VGRRPAKPWKMREKVAVVLPLNRLLLVTIAKARQSNVVQKKLGRIEDLKGS
jgi:hypothetical protein